MINSKENGYDSWWSGVCFKTRHFLLTENAKLTIGKVSNVQFAVIALG
jgi:hypothetical protein